MVLETVHKQGGQESKNINQKNKSGNPENTQTNQAVEQPKAI